MVLSVQNAVLLIAAFTISGCSASILTSRQACLDNSVGRVTCLHSKELVLPFMSRAICPANAYDCLCLKGIDYNNIIRQKHGLGPLKAGSGTMLANAVKHSESFAGGKFEHQDLGKVTSDIQCNIFASGENIAKFSGPSDDPAKKCMDMWENSKGHLENILRDNKMTVIGIYQKNGWTYCTQTFGTENQNGVTKKTECKAVGASGSASASTSVSTSTGTNQSQSGIQSSAGPIPSVIPSSQPGNQVPVSSPSSEPVASAIPSAVLDKHAPEQSVSPSLLPALGSMSSPGSMSTSSPYPVIPGVNVTSWTNSNWVAYWRDHVKAMNSTQA